MTWLLTGLTKLLGGGVLDRVLDSVDKKVSAQADKDRIKADIIIAHHQTRAGFMQAGGFVLMFMFAAPLAFWFAAVCVYSVLWCQGCIFPQDWTVAALPSPVNNWSAQIIMAIFGVVGLTRFAKR